MKAAAADAQLTLDLNRQRQAALALQKYTVLAACLLVPILLGTLLSTAASLKPVAGLGNAQLAKTLELVAPAYCIIFGIIAGAYAGMLESNRGKMVVYAAVLAPLAAAAFYASRLRAL